MAHSSFPNARLKKLISPVMRQEIPIGGIKYRQVGVRLWGKGAYERESIDGSQTKYGYLNKVCEDDVIVNKIWARNGSIAVISKELENCYVSSEFPIFSPDKTILEPNWFHWITKTKFFWNQCDEKSRGTSGKNRIRPDKFLEIEIPLPPLEEQQRIVARIEGLAAKVEEVNYLRNRQESDTKDLLLGAYHKISKSARRMSMAEAAPLIRRPVKVESQELYYELGIRSFGKGTFHKNPIDGLMLGSKRIFYIEPNDLLFNIVFAWEGAVAVARIEDKGRVGSHRFLTCIPRENLALSSYLCFYFLTEEGLEQLSEASPGGAGRNRTLGLKALDNIKIPVPSFEDQLWFDSLLSRKKELDTIKGQSHRELEALIPSILDKAFKGEL